MSAPQLRLHPAEPQATQAHTVRWVLAATVVSGLSGFVIMLLVFKVLGDAGYAPFGVYWSSLFLLVGILFGIQQETTRATAVELGTPSPHRHRRSFWGFSALIAAGVVAVVLVTGIWWAPQTLGTANAGLAVQVALGAGANVFVATFSGVFAGASKWRHLAAVIALDAILRFGGVVGALALGGDLQTLAWSIILPFPLSLAIVALVAPRTTMTLSWTSVGLGRLLVNSAHTVLAATAMALIVNGFPMILAFFARPDQDKELGVLILAITFTRAPILVPMFALQSYLITRFAGSPSSPWRLIGQAIAIIFVVMVLLAGVSALWAGPLFELLGRGHLSLPASALVPLVVSSGFIGALCVTGSALVARGALRENTASWIVAAVVSVAALFIPLPLETRAAVALSAGPLVGLAVQWVCLRRATRQPSAG